MNGNDLRVLVVDDSAMVRQVMQAILGTDRRIIVRAAADPLIAWGKMQKESPDVVITDLEMPRMDGLTFIRKIMAEMPTPVVVCSGLAARGTELALRALEEGAIEVITKPKVGVRDFLHESAVTLLDAVWSAAQAQIKRRPGRPAARKSLLGSGADDRNCGGRFHRRNGSSACFSGRSARGLSASCNRAAHARSLYPRLR
jgi:two-component system chemotaxis response regulator CheB